jgi:hypothetical protein
MAVVADEATETLLDRFAADISQAVPLTALWAHGSLALGDYVPGRSDLDMVALIDAPADDGQRQDLQRVHQSLIRDEPLAAGLHCTYLVESERGAAHHQAGSPGRAHGDGRARRCRRRHPAPQVRGRAAPLGRATGQERRPGRGVRQERHRPRPGPLTPREADAAGS